MHADTVKKPLFFRLNILTNTFIVHDFFEEEKILGSPRKNVPIFRKGFPDDVKSV